MGFKNNQRGQGLVEYLILVALMAVASIAVVRVLNQNVNAKFSSIIYSLQGKRKTVQSEAVTEDLYKKKDLGNFMNGVGGRDSGSGSN